MDGVFGRDISLPLNVVQNEYHPYTIKGQQQIFVDQGLGEKEDGWYLVPGKIDQSSYLLLLFFAATIAVLFLCNYLI